VFEEMVPPLDEGIQRPQIDIFLLDLGDDEVEEGVGLHGDNLVDEILDFEMLDMHFVVVLQLPLGVAQIFDDFGALLVLPLQEEDLYVVLDHHLVVAVLVAIVLLVDAVQFLLLECLHFHVLADVLPLPHLFYVQQLLAFVRPTHEQLLYFLKLLRIQSLEDFQLVVVQTTVLYLAGTHRTVKQFVFVLAVAR
jgi:hypothetical protein